MNNSPNHITASPWISDQGDGTFKNPILHADYSDPDVIRVGNDFYMTASSFGHIPGLPILHSRDLVNWRLINYAIQSMPLPDYEKPQHGNGVWAPSIRYHDHKFWIFYGDPDLGIYMTTAEDPAGTWSEIHLVQEGKGMIDPCPFWDDDGQAYLVHAYAQSRSGIKHRLRMCRMSTNGTKLLEDSVIIIDDPDRHPTIEGPKMYKRNGYYYVFAPAGGVETGWQTVLRSAHPFGPYEDKIVLKQGETMINGPHQGAWIELVSGQSWFIHFQHKDAYGRIVHLQPVSWNEEWPLIGEDIDGDGIGEPVITMRKPDVGAVYPIATPADSDDFEQALLGLQWQWQANPESSWYSLQERTGQLRLFAQSTAGQSTTIFHAPYLLMQKFPALEFQASTLIDLTNLQEGDRAGLIIFGYSYAALVGVRDKVSQGWSLQLIEGNGEDESVVWNYSITHPNVTLKARIESGAQCSFYYSVDGVTFERLDSPIFQATVSKWVGAKIGLFAQALSKLGGYADFEWFKVTGNGVNDR